MSSPSPVPSMSFAESIEFCTDNPDSPACDDVNAFYQYDVSLGANAAFTALYGLSLLLYLGTYVYARRGLAFTFAMTLGTTCEVIGYVGRIIGADNPFDEDGFLIQIITLTIGPAFLAAGIYLCLRRIVTAFGQEHSRIHPKMYTRIFIPCDVIALILQGAGGGIASVSAQNDDMEGTKIGDNVMIGGLAFQSFALLSFMAVSIDFGLRVRKHNRSGAESSADKDPELVRMRESPWFLGFLIALAIATVFIFVRSIFRVAELSQGWTGPIMGNQTVFIIFEGVLVLVAVLVLNIFNPIFCLKPLMKDNLSLSGWRSSKSSKSIESSQPSRDVEKTADGNNTSSNPA